MQIQRKTCDVRKSYETNERINLTQWMSLLPHKVSLLPINRLAIPGSHDSGSYWFDKSQPVAPDQPSFVRTVSVFIKPVVAKVLGNWALTQRLDVTQQLRSGARYLDIRTAYLGKKDEFFIVHGLYGHRLVDIFTQITSFLHSHPKEVVILHLQYCWDMDKTLHKRYMRVIKQLLGDRIYPRSSNGAASESFSRVSLNDIWVKGKQLILIVGDHCPGLMEHTEAEDTELIWQPHSIYSEWFKTDSVSRLIQNLTDHSAKQKTEALNVFQAILTPRRSTVAYDPLGSLEKYIEARNIGEVGCWLERKYDARQRDVNIVMFDFIDVYLARDVVRLNRILEEYGGIRSSRFSREVH